MKTSVLFRQMIVLSTCFTAASFTAVHADVIDFMELAQKNGWDKGISKVWGPSGKAWHFDGSDDSVVPIRGVRFSPEYTFETWLRFDANSTTSKATLLTSDQYRRYHLQIIEGENVNLLYRDEGNSRSGFNAKYKFEPGRWYHIALVFGPEQGVAVYVDGELIKIQLPPVPGMASFPVAAIGAYSVDRNIYDHRFHGSIGTPKLHQRALTAKEIRRLYERNNRVPDVLPIPRSVIYHEDKTSLAIENITEIVLEEDWIDANDPVLAQLRSHLHEMTGQEVSIAQSHTQDQPAIVLRQGDIAQGLDPDTAYEAYTLNIHDGGVLITASSARGAAYGMHALMGMIENGSQTLENVEIHDWPEFPFRGFLYLCHREPPALLQEDFQEDIRKLIPTLSQYRINHLLVRTADWIWLDEPEVFEAAEELFAYAAKHHVDIVPLSRSYGHAKQWLHRDLRTGHTITQADEPVKLTDTEAVALAVPNVIVTQNTPIIVRSEEGVIYEQGVDYEVIDGELKTSWNHPPGTASPWSRPNVLDNEPWRIKRIENGSIRDGETVLVTYDTTRVVRGQGHGAYCPFSEYTREIQSMSIESMTRLMQNSGLKNRYINLGLDEIWVLRGDDGRCCANDWSNEETLIHEINSLDREIRENSTSTRLMMWSDMLDPRQTPGWKVPMDFQSIMDSDLSRDVIMMPWYYGTHTEHIATIFGSLRYLHEQGFGIAGTSGHQPLNNLLWGEALFDTKYQLGADVHGLLYTTWAHSQGDRMGGLPAFAQASWSPGEVYILGVLELFECLRQAGLHTNPGKDPWIEDISEEQIGLLADYGFIKQRLQIALAQVEIDMMVMGYERVEVLRRAGVDVLRIYNMGKKLLEAMDDR